MHQSRYYHNLPFDLNVMLRVITSPSSAFVQIKENEERYLAQSIGLLIVSSILGALVILPFVMIPLDEAYFEGVDDVNLPIDNADVVLAGLVGILKGIVSFAIIYFIGKKLDGNKNWKKVLAVIFHTYVPAIPVSIVLAALVFLMWTSLAEIDPSYLISPDADEKQILSVIGPMLSYVVILVILGVAFLVWIIVISVKAIKVVNEFGTAKAFGLLILAMIISSVVSIPFNV